MFSISQICSAGISALELFYSWAVLEQIAWIAVGIIVGMHMIVSAIIVALLALAVMDKLPAVEGVLNQLLQTKGLQLMYSTSGE